jgi:hypothetical protein
MRVKLLSHTQVSRTRTLNLEPKRPYIVLPRVSRRFSPQVSSGALMVNESIGRSWSSDVSLDLANPIVIHHHHVLNGFLS